MLARTAAARLRIPSLSQKANYRLVGGPISNAGDNDRITHETILTQVNAVTKEPMRIYIVSGYVSCLYLCHYPERPQPNVLLLDSGTATDARRVDFFLRNHKHADVAVGNEGEGASSSSEQGEHRTDAATASAFPVLTAVRRSLGLVGSSHAHEDHLGATHTYAANGVPVTAPANLERYYRGFWGRLQLYSEWYLIHLFAYMLGRRRLEFPNHNGTLPRITVPYLTDSRPLPCGFDDWTAVTCHGHTSHMMGLFHAATGMFYCADFIIPRGRRFIAPLPVDMPQEYLRNIQRLRSLPVRYLLAAHGGVIDMDDLAGGWQFVLDEVESYVREGKMAPALRKVSLISMFSAEPGMFQPEAERPRGAIRHEDLEPVPVMHLK